MMDNIQLKENTVLVSVVMPAYNAAQHIEAAIASVQAQTVADWELIVIDDGSGDDTRGIVNGLAQADSRIRLYVNPRNMGTARTRNRGFDLCRGEYVALLDSDDIWMPDKLEKQLALVRREKADIVYSSYAIVNEHGEKLCEDFLVPPETDLNQLLKKNVIGCSTVLLSRELIKRFQFNSDYYHEDYVLWLQALQAGMRAVGVADVLVNYRVHSGSRASNKLASACRRWNIYHQYLKLPVAQSAYYLVQYGLAGLKKYRKV